MYGYYERRTHVFRDGTTMLPKQSALEVGTGVIANDPFQVVQPIKVATLCAQVLGETLSQTGGTNLAVQFNSNPIPGSTSNQVILGTLKIPAVAAGSAYAIGTIFRLPINPTKVVEGGEITIEVVTAYGGTNPSGNLQFWFEYSEEAEVAANETNTVVLDSTGAVSADANL